MPTNVNISILDSPACWYKNDLFLCFYLTTLSVPRLYSVYDRMINECETVGAMRIDGVKESIRRNPLRAVLFTTNPT
jgi:hypothetical protein